MKLPADGSARVNSATVVARKATAIPAAMMVSGAATPAVTAITPNAKEKSLPGPIFATVETVRSQVPSWPDLSRPASEVTIMTVVDQAAKTGSDTRRLRGYRRRNTPPLRTPAAHHQPGRDVPSRSPVMPFSQPDRGRRAKAVAAVPVNVKVRQATRRMPRLARWLAGRNSLRRPVDRIEGAVMVALIAAFGVAVAMASVFGAHTYQAQRAATAGLRPSAAWLIQAGPLGGGLGHVGQAKEQGCPPAGGEHTGVLT